MNKPTLNKFTITLFFSVLVFCLLFATDLQASVAAGQGFSIRPEIVIISVIGLLAFTLVLRAIGLRHYIEKSAQLDNAVEEEKAEQRRSVQMPKVVRPADSFTKRLELAYGSQIPSDVSLPSVFRGENSDLCEFRNIGGAEPVFISLLEPAHTEAAFVEPEFVDIEKSLPEDIHDSIDNTLCDMHALIYNINVAIEKIHSNPLSSAQAKSILLQSQMNARDIQHSLRTIQNDLKSEAISKQRSVG